MRKTPTSICRSRLENFNLPLSILPPFRPSPFGTKFKFISNIELLIVESPAQYLIT